MSNSSDEVGSVLLVIFGVCFVLIICGGIGKLCGEIKGTREGIKYHQLEAITHNAAYWDTDQKGNPVFKWNDQKKNILTEESSY